MSLPSPVVKLPDCQLNWEWASARSDLLPSIVTALPSSPADGREIYFQDATLAAAGIAWHLRYRAASASAYKWEAVSGNSPLTVAGGGTTGAVLAGYTATDYAASPRITCPLTGDYYVTARANAYLTAGAPAEFLLSVGISTAFPSTYTGASATATYTTINLGGDPTVYTANAGNIMRPMIAAGGGTWDVRFDSLSMWPRRLG